MSVTIGSLCSGIGGLELGIERALSARTVWQAEVDPHASAVLAHRFPEATNHGDLRATNWAEVEPVDLMCFGFPCQDISTAGRKAGLEGERSALWFDCARTVRLVRPRYLLVENVAALLARGFDRVLADLAEMGYVGRWGCLRSSDVGAPHKRDRIFIAAAADTGSAGAGRDRRAVPRAAAGTRRAGGDVRAALDGRPAAPDAGGPGREGRRPAHPTWGPVSASSAPADAEDHGQPGPGPTRRRGDRPQDSRPAPPHPDAGRRGTDLADHASGQPDAAWGDYTAAVRRWETTHGPAPAPRDHLGRLNPALPEWMMGFPPGWVTDLPLPRSGQLRCVGNAVQPQVAEFATRTLLLPLLEAEAAA